MEMPEKSQYTNFYGVPYFLPPKLGVHEVKVWGASRPTLKKLKQLNSFIRSAQSVLLKTGPGALDVEPKAVTVPKKFFAVRKPWYQAPPTLLILSSNPPLFELLKQSAHLLAPDLYAAQQAHSDIPFANPMASQANLNTLQTDNQQPGAQTRRYHINRIDIQLAQDLVAILKLFYEQTLQVSTLGSARLTHIIVFIDKITDHLSNAIKGDGNEYPPVLRNACRFGLQLTNKYYTLTDCSPLYRIAMVLHPSFKDKYFKIAGWEADWITEALRLTREMFNTFYKPNVDILPSSQPNKSNKPKTGNIAQLALAAQPGLSANDPLDTWLASGLILDNGSPVNALKWWIRQKRAGNSHGGLLRMALDVLSCPGMCTVISFSLHSLIFE
ncbi:hypothetical protein PSTG_01779 [Puccinia striiformis f. sp. tritici PST-78]|uniref:HAT C-terminal dimerisation domain-containing protein n=1 Tax=Puccinia striiformis f. sp. tritici PST-78 TaxID=1165861 RepID=A0A0L0W110_9BASI|nr:hypothetical protein PSTG_01779 [Puccinia striiformis f. sp. tritici PST-78]